jgi:hypothetical protein
MSDSAHGFNRYLNFDRPVTKAFRSAKVAIPLISIQLPPRTCYRLLFFLLPSLISHLFPNLTAAVFWNLSTLRDVLSRHVRRGIFFLTLVLGEVPLLLMRCHIPIHVTTTTATIALLTLSPTRMSTTPHISFPRALVPTTLPMIVARDKVVELALYRFLAEA